LLSDVLNLSKGKTGALPSFRHPQTGVEAKKLPDRYLKTLERLKNAGADEAVGAGKLSTALWQRTKTPVEAVNRQMEFWMSDLDSEPALAKRKATRIKLGNELDEAVVTIGGRAAKRSLPFLDGQHNDELREIGDHAVRQLRPYAQAYETAMDKEFSLKYRYLTGLAANFSDEAWAERNRVYISQEYDGEWMGLIGMLASDYLSVVAFVPIDDGADSDDSKRPDVDKPKCEDELKLPFKGQISAAGVSFAFSADCKKINFDLHLEQEKIGAGKFASASIGPFMHADATWDGSHSTLFVGSQGDVNAGGKFLNVKAGAKSGVYVEFDHGQLYDMGGRVDIAAGGQAGPIKRTFGEDSMKFSLMPDIPKPARGPQLLNFVQR
jgi:hypothetical protein